MRNSETAFIPRHGKKLAEHGIPRAGHAARQIAPKDYVNFDLLIGMDEENIRNMRRVFSGDPEGKSLSCSTTPGAAGTSPIRGIRAILKRPGAT